LIRIRVVGRCVEKEQQEPGRAGCQWTTPGPSRPEGRSGLRRQEMGIRILLLGFDDFAAFQAGGADADALGGGAHFGVHRPQVHIPAPLGDVMGVADIVSELRALAADLTYLCHGLLQVRSELNV